MWLKRFYSIMTVYYLHLYWSRAVHMNQVDFVSFLCFSTVIDYRRRQCVRKTKMTAPGSCSTSVFFARHDVICDLLQYRHAQNEVFKMFKIGSIFVDVSKISENWDINY